MGRHVAISSVVALLLVTGSIGCRSEPRTWQVEMPVVRFLAPTRAVEWTADANRIRAVLAC